MASGTLARPGVRQFSLAFRSGQLYIRARYRFRVLALSPRVMTPRRSGRQNVYHLLSSTYSHTTLAAPHQARSPRFRRQERTQDSHNTCPSVCAKL